MQKNFHRKSELLRKSTNKPISMNFTNSRRSFIRNSSLTATGLFFVSITGTNHKALKELSIGCAPPKPTQLFGSVGSVKSGNWSDPSTWGGRVPSQSDTPLIATGHVVKFDLATTTVAGLNINNGGVLEFDSSKSVTLQSNKNIVVQGTLKIRPASIKNIHTLRFIGINEKSFVGGGMDPIASDVGLWVMAAGRLDIVGAEKTPWTRVTDTVSAGSSSFGTTDTPRGWAEGDEVVLVPTSTPAENSLEYDWSAKKVTDRFRQNFEKRTITSVSGSSIKVNAAYTYDTHKKVVAPGGPTWTAEVLNLHRNVRIEGTATGRTHILIRSSVPQTIQNAALRYMGPRKNQKTDRGDMIAGRYGIHFHHCGYGSKGSQITGNVGYECGNHIYVPHVSHGINMSNNVAYDCIEVAFWWDHTHLTHYTTWENNLIALNYHIPKTADMTTTVSGTTSGGMVLGMGDGNIATGNVCVYSGLGDTGSRGAFSWEGDNEGVWIFKNNLAHSNHNAIRVWQNSTLNHTIFGLECYNNFQNLFHGAYVNPYTYRDCTFYNGIVEVMASSANSNGVRFENVKFIQVNAPHCVEVIRSAVASGDKNENLFINCLFRGFTVSAVRNEAGGVTMADRSIRNERKGVALVMCDFGGGQPWSFSYKGANNEEITHPEGWFRIQPKSGQCQLIVRGKGSQPVITNIAPFFPTLIGNGEGLHGEYYNDAKLANKVFERVDATISFKEWYKYKAQYNLPLGIHHLITGAAHSVKWTGKIQAQYTEDYKIGISGAGGYKIWIDQKLVLDMPGEKFDERDLNFSKPVSLKAGEFYDIEVQYWSASGYTSAHLYWKCPSMEKEVLVPQSQLYSNDGSQDSSKPIPDNAANQAPVANAGTDVSISLPTNSVTLNGSLSTDSDGSIVSYKWLQVSGPSAAFIVNSSSATTNVNNLVAGVYVFRLEVKDDKGLATSDTISVKVNEAGNKPPIANAGPDISIVLPTNNTTLNGAGSQDPDGTLVYYKWTKVSGPGQFIIGNASAATTSLSNLIAGEYIFRLEVKDSRGAISTDEVKVTVNTKVADSSSPGQGVTVTVGSNPTTTEFNLTFNSANKKDWIEIYIYDQWYKEVGYFTKVYSGFNVKVGRNWKTGTYYIHTRQARVKSPVVTIMKLPS
jgi:hypothetical protein